MSDDKGMTPFACALCCQGWQPESKDAWEGIVQDADEAASGNQAISRSYPPKPAAAAPPLTGPNCRTQSMTMMKTSAGRAGELMVPIVAPRCTRRLEVVGTVLSQCLSYLRLTPSQVASSAEHLRGGRRSPPRAWNPALAGAYDCRAGPRSRDARRDVHLPSVKVTRVGHSTGHIRS